MNYVSHLPVIKLSDLSEHISFAATLVQTDSPPLSASKTN